MKTAVITGVTGQDGAYLAEFLLSKGYQVYATYRRAASVNFWRIKELGIESHKNLHLIEYELTDQASTIRMVSKIQPDEIYNLAAQSFVGSSFEQPIATAQVTGLGALHLLEAIRIVNPKIRFYQASTSEMFGEVQEIPQTEKTPFYPRSPYGVAKVFAHWMTINYRESYDMFCSNGILFNHDSPLRGLQFVTRKISDGVARIAQRQLSHIELGNLDAKRDWGYAKDYIEGMYLMLQADAPDTFVLATNRTESVRDFVKMSFQAIGIDLTFEGRGVNEIAIDIKTGRPLVKVNPKFYRPAEVELLIGDPKKARDILGWSASTSLERLSKMMVDADMKRVESGISF
jgi:GDPmannose 4,6-dehydratase